MEAAVLLVLLLEALGGLGRAVPCFLHPLVTAAAAELQTSQDRHDQDLEAEAEGLSYLMQRLEPVVAEVVLVVGLAFVDSTHPAHQLGVRYSDFSVEEVAEGLGL